MCVVFRDELFENQAAGASPDATKVLVIITDGDPSDRDRNGIVKKYNDKEIIRLVIGVSWKHETSPRGGVSINPLNAGWGQTVSQAPFQVGGRLLETLVVEFWSIIGKPETWVYTLNSLSPCILLHLIVLYE